MKPRNQNKIPARSVNTTVVLFVIQLFLLFDKTESGEPGDSTDSTDSSDSTFSRKVAPSGVAKPRKRGVLISGVSRLYDELCSQLCEIIPALNEKILARSASQLKN